MLLAIDTATQVISLALHDGLSLRAEQTWHTANNHTAELAPAVITLLDRCGVGVNDLTALAVSIGPGSYSGLRIGVALAKGMASAHKLPLVGVSTLDILASAQPYYAGNALIVAVEAGRARVIAATYRWSKGRWVHRGDAQTMDWDMLFNSVDGPAYLTGDMTEAGMDALKAAQTRDVPIKLIPAVYRLRRAGFLAQEALERLDTEEDDGAFEAARITPIYVKTKDIP
jgi:tRNA threonylcarbamoyladenosine biosynthesis protein TsaB